MHITPYHLFFSFLILGFFISILSSILTRNWLFSTGLIFLDQFPYLLCLFNFFFYFFLFLSFIFYYFTKLMIMFYIGSFFSIIILIIDFFYGLTWLIDVDQFFIRLETSWKDSINTALVTPIQYQLKCCGFKMIKEVSNDTCTYSDKNTCLKMLINSYKMNAISTAIFILIHSCSQAFLITLYYLTIQQLNLKVQILYSSKVNNYLNNFI